MSADSQTGLYIPFEGSDGSGKSTQIRLVADRLRSEGFDVVTTYEPGATSLGKQLRTILLSPETGDLTSETELALFTASRTDLNDKVIQPALAENKIVLSDRNWYSSWVYQGARDPVARDTIETVTRLLLPKRYCDPDETICLELTEAERMKRMARTGASVDRIEQRDEEYFEAVSKRYSELPRRFGATAIICNGNKEEVTANIWAAIEPALGRL